MRTRVFGVDFSGAVDAGRKIWIASGTVENDVLLVDSCRRGDRLPNSTIERDVCLDALRRLVASERSAIFGLDFPFGLPRDLVGGRTWEEVVALVAQQVNAEAFRSFCVRASPGREVRRVTDRQARTPFSPYNVRVFRQTYHGIAGLLAPLIRSGLASILPMQCPDDRRAWILEVCPASTLKALGLYRPYKGRSDRCRAMRRAIVETLERIGPLRIADGTCRTMMLEDDGGDALDSVVAALGVCRTLRSLSAAPTSDPAYAVEGYVYV